MPYFLSAFIDLRESSGHLRFCHIPFEWIPNIPPPCLPELWTPLSALTLCLTLGQSAVPLSICVLSTNPSLGQDLCPSSSYSLFLTDSLWLLDVLSVCFFFTYYFLTHCLTLTIPIFPIPLFYYHSSVFDDLLATMSSG